MISIEMSISPWVCERSGLRFSVQLMKKAREVRVVGLALLAQLGLLLAQVGLGRSRRSSRRSRIAELPDVVPADAAFRPASQSIAGWRSSVDSSAQLDWHVTRWRRPSLPPGTDVLAARANELADEVLPAERRGASRSREHRAGAAAARSGVAVHALARRRRGTLAPGPARRLAVAGS